MPLESNTSEDIASAISEPTTGTGAPEADSSVTQAESNPSADGSSPETETASAATQTVGGPGSLKTGTETTTSQAQKPSQPADELENLRKQYAGSTREWQRERDRAAEFERQAQQYQQQALQVQAMYQGITPQDVNQYRQYQQQASQPVWNPQHPEHSRFQEIYQRAQFYDQLVNSAQTEDEKNIFIARRNAGFSSDEFKTLKDFRNASQRSLMEFQTDPQGYMQRNFQQFAQQFMPQWQQQSMQKQEQTIRGQQDVKQWIDSNPSLATRENLQKAHGLMGNGWSWEAAVAKIERDDFASRVNGAEKTKKSAEEKERLLKGNAEVSRDAVTKRSKHPEEIRAEANAVAKKRGYSLNDPRVMDIHDSFLRKYSKG